MPGIKKKNFKYKGYDLRPEQIEKVTEVSAKTGVSASKFVREAIDKAISEYQTKTKEQ